MIRVVYHWKVDPQDFTAFEACWSATTNRIHDTVPGALGSFLLRRVESESEVLTVARWDSLKSWRTFWQDSDPHEMKEMGALGERISATAYEEVGDHTR